MCGSATQRALSRAVDTIGCVITHHLGGVICLHLDTKKLMFLTPRMGHKI